jgi:hypothetical protein
LTNSFSCLRVFLLGNDLMTLGGFRFVLDESLYMLPDAVFKKTKDCIVVVNSLGIFLAGSNNSRSFKVLAFYLKLLSLPNDR